MYMIIKLELYLYLVFFMHNTPVFQRRIMIPIVVLLSKNMYDMHNDINNSSFIKSLSSLTRLVLNLGLYTDRQAEGHGTFWAEIACL